MPISADNITMTIPDAPTITAIATLLGVLFTGVVSVLNAIFSRSNSRKLNTKVDNVHEDTKQTVLNTNGQLTAVHADNRALVETNRLLQDQISKMTPRPSRSTDPQPLVPGVVEPAADPVATRSGMDPNRP